MKWKDSLLIAQEFKCFYCPKELNIHTATKEHVIPKSKGGTDTDNIVLACRECNRNRGNDPIPKKDMFRARQVIVAANQLRARINGGKVTLEGVLFQNPEDIEKYKFRKERE